MSEYTESLSIEPIELESGMWAWRLTAPLNWEIGYKDSGLWVTVPTGFTTDLMSIPPIARIFINRYDPATAKAACLHDWLRPTTEDILIQERPVWDVQMAAGEFFHALKADKVQRWRRVCCYLAVALFGTRRGEW